jgi:hypothetical protein
MTLRRLLPFLGSCSVYTVAPKSLIRTGNRPALPYFDPVKRKCTRP